MARFSDNWEKDFRPLWELEKIKGDKIGSAMDPRSKAVRLSRHLQCTVLTVVTQYLHLIV